MSTTSASNYSCSAATYSFSTNGTSSATWYGYPYGYNGGMPNYNGYGQPYWNQNVPCYPGVQNPSQWNFTQLQPESRMPFTIGGVAFCITNFEAALGESFLPPNRQLLDYTGLDKESLLKIASALMKHAELGEYLQTPVLFFLFVYTFIKGDTDSLEVVRRTIKTIYNAAQCGPQSVDIGEDCGEIIRLTVEAAASLECLAEEKE
jgi:hypothetical protein